MPKVLVVDDDPVSRRSAAAIFSEADYHVRTAASGVEALDIIESEGRFDILVSDIVMPSMSGHRLAQWVAAHHHSTATILMTAYDPGCPGCPYSPRCVIMPKPLLPDRVLSMARRMLARRERTPVPAQSCPSLLNVIREG